MIKAFDTLRMIEANEDANTLILEETQVYFVLI